jgi:acetylglutamate kinase
VVIHGGGNMVTEWLKKQGVETKFVRGERITDKPSLDIVAAVLGGLANKQIVATINNLGGRAVGISGVDGGLIQGRVANPEWVMWHKP